MNTTTAATEAQVTIATIRTWCRRGVIAATKTAGRWIIDTASLTHRIAIGAMKRPAHKETRPMIDLTATYTYTEYIPEETLTTITPQVKQRTTPEGENLLSIRGLAPLFADRFDAITDTGDRVAALTAFRGATIVISDQHDADWDGDPQAREGGQLRTTYRGTVPGISISDVLDLAAQLRAQLT